MVDTVDRNQKQRGDGGKGNQDSNSESSNKQSTNASNVSSTSVDSSSKKCPMRCFNCREEHYISNCPEAKGDQEKHAAAT
jgi:hypothetical protein